MVWEMKNGKELREMEIKNQLNVFRKANRMEWNDGIQWTKTNGLIEDAIFAVVFSEERERERRRCCRYATNFAVICCFDSLLLRTFFFFSLSLFFFLTFSLSLKHFLTWVSSTFRLTIDLPFPFETLLRIFFE